VDWPGQLAATVFAQGCPWDCAYCHNPHLLFPTAEPDAESLPWRAVSDWLATRVGLLDGVVFSGGEPLAQSALLDAIAEVRALGLSVALHTSGVVPARFAEALPLLDWVGFDVKAPFASYGRVTRTEGSGERALASLRALLASQVLYEVRTTVHPALLGEEDLLELAEELRVLGVNRWVLQRFRADGARPLLPPAASVPDGLVGRLGDGFASFEVRG
jgi:pyruvate formate lyase activating enzyme